MLVSHFQRRGERTCWLEWYLEVSEAWDQLCPEGFGDASMTKTNVVGSLGCGDTTITLRVSLGIFNSELEGYGSIGGVYSSVLGFPFIRVRL